MMKLMLPLMCLIALASGLKQRGLRGALSGSMVRGDCKGDKCGEFFSAAGDVDANNVEGASNSNYHTEIKMVSFDWDGTTEKGDRLVHAVFEKAGETKYPGGCKVEQFDATGMSVLGSNKVAKYTGILACQTAFQKAIADESIPDISKCHPGDSETSCHNMFYNPKGNTDLPIGKSGGDAMNAALTSIIETIRGKNSKFDNFVKRYFGIKRLRALRMKLNSLHKVVPDVNILSAAWGKVDAAAWKAYILHLCSSSVLDLPYTAEDILTIHGGKVKDDVNFQSGGKLKLPAVCVAVCVAVSFRHGRLGVIGGR